MCGCGRKRPTEVVTSAQAAAEMRDRELVSKLEQQTVEGAEALLRSASNAARNARSE